MKVLSRNAMKNLIGGQNPVDVGTCTARCTGCKNVSCNGTTCSSTDDSGVTCDGTETKCKKYGDVGCN